MNQILYTIEEENAKKKLKSIMLFFSIFLIVFGIALSGVGAYNLVTSNAKKKEMIEMAKIPEVKLTADGNRVLINVEHVRNIKNIVYSWNNGEETTLNETKSTGIKEYIDIPAGRNTLDVKVTDVAGKYSTLSGEFAYDGTYMDLSVVDNKNLKIKVTDVKGLQSVSYRWNLEDEVTENARSLDTYTMEVNSTIPTGVNTITVIAVNNDNKTEKKEMTVQGITKPKIRVNYNTERTLFSIKISDDQGIESYSYELYSAKVKDIAKDGRLIDNYTEKLVKGNQNKVTVNGDKEVSDTLALLDGFNYLIIRAKNIEGAEEVLAGWCVKYGDIDGNN